MLADQSILMWYLDVALAEVLVTCDQHLSKVYHTLRLLVSPFTHLRYHVYCRSQDTRDCGNI